MPTVKTLYDCLGGAALLLMAGCAAAPTNITATPVAPGTYADWDCQRVTAEQASVDGQLDDLMHHQQNARDWDTVGLILFGLPISSMGGGNHENAIAKLKGEHNALVQQVSTCNQRAARL